MSDWKPKRFWQNSAVVEAGDGYSVELDGRPVRTPAKAHLLLPTQEMATEIAVEWDAQEKEVDPTTMPFTRSANAAIDKVRIQHAEVADMLAAYGDSDLVCYRADHPAELIDRQAKAWDPALRWLMDKTGVQLEARTGVIHKPQSAESSTALAEIVHEMGPFHLAAFHDLVSLTGSLVLGLAAARDWRQADEIWTLSRVDEQWQEDQWGFDEEAGRQSEIKRQAFLHAKRFYDVSG